MALYGSLRWKKLNVPLRSSMVPSSMADLYLYASTTIINNNINISNRNNSNPLQSKAYRCQALVPPSCRVRNAYCVISHYSYVDIQFVIQSASQLSGAFSSLYIKSQPALVTNPNNLHRNAHALIHTTRPNRLNNILPENGNNFSQ
jgi:hypothetical protein